MNYLPGFYLFCCVVFILASQSGCRQIDPVNEDSAQSDTSFLEAITQNEQSNNELPRIVAVLDSTARNAYCACTDGEDAREYLHLTRFLIEATGDTFRTIYPTDLASAFVESPSGKCDLIFGKESIIDAALKESNNNGFEIPIRKIGYLTNADGNIMLRGLFVTHPLATFQTLEDAFSDDDSAEGKQPVKLILGKPSSIEKNQLALKKLVEKNIKIECDPFLLPTCRETLIRIVSQKEPPYNTIGVISDYAIGILKSDEFKFCFDDDVSVRVLDKTDETPFIAVYISSELPEDKYNELISSLKKLNFSNSEVVFSLEIQRMLKLMKSKGIFFLDDNEKN
ncbi:MAG: hypothetical protein ACRC2T_14960 [Thermoguttaceae bacterium]